MRQRLRLKIREIELSAKVGSPTPTPKGAVRSCGNCLEESSKIPPLLSPHRLPGGSRNQILWTDNFEDVSISPKCDASPSKHRQVTDLDVTDSGLLRAQDSVLCGRCSVGTRHAFFLITFLSI